MRVVKLLMKTWDGFNKCHGPVMAAALSYSTLFAIFPLLLSITAVLGFFFATATALALEAQQYVLQQVRINIPVAYEIIAQTLDTVQRERGTLTIWAVGLLIVSGSTIFGQLEYALDVMLDCWPRERSFWQSILARVINAFMVLVVTLLLFAGMLLDAMTKFLQTNTATLPESNVFWSLVTPLISTLITGLLFALVIRVVPRRTLNWRAILPAALAGGILWEVGKQLLAWYIGRLAWQATYGTLAGAVILLMWVFYSAQILLLSAKLASTLDEERDEREGKAAKEAKEEKERKELVGTA